ncbi:E3 ubiquitin-protein ligase TRIM39-like [Pseudoliparis swirei]|uniref:E3 ubiquitin-protein ligase TRIM39-like n=1 Tax=Pseudoliparis swirei TaxID=2059687 RepID=UPI0024BE90C7|nr:E3 ubiquitin-protein ligase TRIM39-like [Pseudoliparis swirei]
MAAASNLPSEDQFLCSVCLDVFTDPVTTPCGHNFCKKCLNDYWNTNNQNMCPLCKKVFTSRPELLVNTFICEMVSQFRQSTQQKASSSSSEQQEMCLKHDKPLELFCRTDQTCVCMLCTVLDHKMHNVVPLKQECEGKKVELQKTEAETQEMIQRRRLKIQEVQHNVKLSEEDADREKAEGVQVFTGLKESVERKLKELITTIEEKQRSTKKQAEGAIREMEQEISDLMKRSTEVEQLSLSEDHLHLLQSVQSLNIHHPPPTKDWSQVSVPPASHEGTVRRAVSQLEETLSNMMKTLVEVEMKRFQKFAVDVTLDPETAHPRLFLSDDGKQVKRGDVRKNLPDNPQRFTSCFYVLGKQSFSSGRFYFEVLVKGKTSWTLGVTRESVNRKEYITLSPQNGFWTIELMNRNVCYARHDPPVLLSLKSVPQKVGVFVDYEEGLVSFYDVEAAALIYSFTGCSFKEKLLPLFSPRFNFFGTNSSPLIISP